MNIHKAWNIEHFKRLAEYNARLEKIMRDAVIKSASLVSRHNPSSTKDDLFSFNSDRQLNAEIDSILSDLSNEITSYTSNAEAREWNLAYAQETDYISQLYKVALQTNSLKEGYSELMLSMKSRNLDALEEFRKRKIGGMNLSGRVWNYTESMKQQMEVSIDTALMTGMSADRLAVSLLDLLQNPDALFRRVRDENDELRMSKAMRAYHPGNGVYRSAYKNAMRLARSEINMAYRSSDSHTAQMLDCVVGIRINLSNNHTLNGEPFTDICDTLAGEYPKDFKFAGWHPQCRCYITYINKTDEEFWRDLESGENNDSVNSVKDVPEQFKEWISKNEKRIEKSRAKGTLPYFIKDNEKYINATKQYEMTLKDVEYILNNFDSKYFNNRTTEQVFDIFKEKGFNKFDIASLGMEIKNMVSENGLEVETMKIILRGNSMIINARSSLDNNGDFFDIMRTITVKDNGAIRVNHALFIVPESMRKKGISKKFLKRSFEIYKKCGVSELRLFANLEVGGYAWARYGFSTDYSEQQLLNVIKDIESTKKASFKDAKEIVKDFFSKNQDNELFPMNILTGYNWSKDLLMGMNWEGLMDLENRTQLEVFLEYIYN